MEDSETVIRTKGLTKLFGERRAVDDLNLVVGRGEVFGFLGPNGAGKSTTIRMLLGLIAPTDGQAFVAGHSVQSQRKQALKHVGAIVEAPCFYDHVSARKNLEFAQTLHGHREKGRVDEVLELIGLKGREDDPVGTFSHGMRQRLGIGRALLHRPAVVILDEPSDGLDPRGRREVRDIIVDISQRLHITVLLSSHLLNEMETLCNRLGVIYQGRLLFQGGVDELHSQHAQTRSLRVVADQLAQAAELLRRHAGVLEVTTAEGHLLATLKDGTPASELSSALVEGKVGLQEISPVRESLEDVFLKLTGGST